jgi:AMMECR1 domain-containing protein
MLHVERADVSKSVLSQILEYLTSQNTFSPSVATHHIISKRREKQVLALLEVVPETDWNDSHVLDLCEKAQFYQVCLHILLMMFCLEAYCHNL